MNPNDPNVILLELVADRLGDRLREELVFVGGAVAGLLITDPGLPAIRPTEDVDLIVDAATRAEYHQVEDALRALGFVHDLSVDAPICRWRIGGIAVDVMPTVEGILNFSNRWYPAAMECAVTAELPSGKRIRLVTAPVFLASKLEAFAGRGNGDFLFSHDLGDLIAVLDGRAELLAECRAATAELKAYLGKWMLDLLSTPSFRDALPGHLPSDLASQERLPDLIAKMRAIAALAE